MSSLRLGLSLLIIFLLGACQTPSERPIREVVFASAAMKAAARASAEKYSPDYYRKAENHYWRAKSYFTTRRFDLCRKHAYQARRFAERAELDANLKLIAKDSSKYLY